MRAGNSQLVCGSAEAGGRLPGRGVEFGHQFRRVFLMISRHGPISCSRTARSRPPAFPGRPCHIEKHSPRSCAAGSMSRGTAMSIRNKGRLRPLAHDRFDVLAVQDGFRAAGRADHDVRLRHRRQAVVHIIDGPTAKFAGQRLRVLQGAVGDDDGCRRRSWRCAGGRPPPSCPRR